eukprot:2652913-Rhodomonas_salina.1
MAKSVRNSQIQHGGMAWVLGLCTNTSSVITVTAFSPCCADSSGLHSHRANQIDMGQYKTSRRKLAIVLAEYLAHRAHNEGSPAHAKVHNSAWQLAGLALLSQLETLQNILLVHIFKQANL